MQTRIIMKHYFLTLNLSIFIIVIKLNFFQMAPSCDIFTGCQIPEVPDGHYDVTFKRHLQAIGLFIISFAMTICDHNCCVVVLMIGNSCSDGYLAQRNVKV